MMQPSTDRPVVRNSTNVNDMDLSRKKEYYYARCDCFLFQSLSILQVERSRLTRLSASRLYQFIVSTILKNSTRNYMI